MKFHKTSHNKKTSTLLRTCAAILLVLLITSCNSKAGTTADFYVASDGKDTNPGTADAPFATLTKARDAVRQKIAGGLTKDILVLIHGGTYQQTETLAFGPQDSGTEAFSITYAAYPGEKVILSGGHKITGWKKGQGSIWVAEVPDVKAGKLYFRQLFVNGKRTFRARTPNVNDKTPWWIIKTSTLTEQEDKPFTVTVNNPIRSYKNIGDVELVCIYNNEGGRKRLESVSEAEQTLTIAPPHKWNPKCFGNDWYLSAPTEGKACYLENALEMLDQQGEWYLDRQTGIVSYWPRPGEDLKKDEVIVPLVQKTLLAVVGTQEQPVVNLNFKGIHAEYVDWPLPAWGYNGLFSCNVFVGSKEKAGHRFIEAAVEFENARSCNFVGGGISHVGGMALCLRDGTSFNRVEGNEICDLGGGGIGAGGCNVAGGYLYAAPPPEPNDYKGYRIANNYVHDCGTDYFGAAGICLYLAQDSIVAHNLVHDISYCGVMVAGSQDPNVKFAKNNTIEYNHIYNSMKVTVDGAGLYITFANYDRGTLVRSNLIHDTLWNTFGRGEVASGIHDTIPCHGLYLDGSNIGCTYENNVVYRNAGGPLLFNSHKSRNKWVDNLFQKEGTPPEEFIEVMKACTGLEPAYCKAILNTEPKLCNCYMIGETADTAPWAAYQFDLSKDGRGVVQVVRRSNYKDELLHLKLCGLNASGLYRLKGYTGTLAQADQHFYEGTFFGNCDKNLFTTYLAALGDLPILSNVHAITLEGTTQMSGRELIEQGLQMKLGQTPQVVWIAYERVK
jgi:hypothetical protein